MAIIIRLHIYDLGLRWEGYVFIERSSIDIHLIIITILRRLKSGRGLLRFFRNLAEVFNLLFMALDKILLHFLSFQFIEF